jgi:hypothetical protein
VKSKQETSLDKLLGRKGEIFAAKYLETQGFRIIGRNVYMKLLGNFYYPLSARMKSSPNCRRLI